MAEYRRQRARLDAMDPDLLGRMNARYGDEVRAALNEGFGMKENKEPGDKKAVQGDKTVRESALEIVTTMLCDDLATPSFKARLLHMLKAEMGERPL